MVVSIAQDVKSVKQHLTWSKKPVNKTTISQWHMKDDVLCFCGCWYVPPGLLRHEILKLYYNDLFAGHIGHVCTLELLEHKFYWPKMTSEVRNYCGSCLNCRHAKTLQHKPYGKLQLLSMPMGPRKNWTMDFITKLLLNLLQDTTYDSILIVVDRYAKYLIYILAQEDWNAETFANVIVENVFTQFVISISIISDKSLLFTSDF